jgi:hypothetical protein
MVLNARELLEDLGMHARALKGAALSARRLEDLESRMFELESGLESLATRGKGNPKSDKLVCPKCSFTCNTQRELTVRDVRPSLSLCTMADFPPL